VSQTNTDAGSTHRTVMVFFEGKAYPFVDPVQAIIDKTSGLLFLTDRNNVSYVFSGSFMVQEWKRP